MNYEINSELYREIAPNGYRIRGFFLSEIIILERLMDRFISKHFSDNNDKQVELIELILSTKKIGFEGKRRVLKAITDLHYQTVFKEKDKLYSDLKKIEDFRNELAHNFMDTRLEALENAKNGIIGFIKHDNQTTVVTYDKNEIDNFRMLIKDIQKMFFDAIN